MEKNVGFNRHIRLAWLDATAALCAETDDAAVIRARLEEIVGEDIASAVNRRKAIDILLNIWIKTGEIAPALRNDAVACLGGVAGTGDRLWLHFGLTVLYYPFFRETAAAVGQLARYGDPITPGAVKQRLVAARGQLGSLDKAVERVVYSLRDWRLLVDADRRSAYRPAEPLAAIGGLDLEVWLLACALQAHPADEVLFADLVRLPELFPFRFGVGIDDLRRSPRFEVQRQGGGWDMVRLSSGTAG